MWHAGGNKSAHRGQAVGGWVLQVFALKSVSEYPAFPKKIQAELFNSIRKIILIFRRRFNKS